MNEFEWIDRYLRPLAKSPGADRLKNDVGVLRSAGSPLIATLDTLVEGVHFLNTDPLSSVAQKLLRVNISDVLCKGGVPRDALLSIAMPTSFTESDFASLCEGLRTDLDDWNIALIGGDTVRTPGPLTLSLTLTGACLTESVVQRSGAIVGDTVYVTGVIGRGGLGLSDALRGEESDHTDHYRIPELPPAAIADLIAAFATASIDVSDGLISDSGHIAGESGVSIQLDLSKVPFAEQVHDAEGALTLATAGDDYQTLFTAAAEDEHRLLATAATLGIRISFIGTVGQGDGVKLSFNGEDVSLPALTGYRH
ncbi:thiamine-phosphate kinase [Henriciella barbarensis]|uniref:Thiamine-monophosphate kinase n=1 Tax=Henriciella barbarensis TaxID=86342 RepID=A0A399R915_9PROT|nr:thiamine-phosphate kinase [Henriciella barbarensis]RIJ26162.1 thiamine-phosphate kinase [Henriciella barbarensis]